MHVAVEVWKKLNITCWMLSRFAGLCFTCSVINKLLCGAPTIALEGFPPCGPFCCHSGLFRGLIFVGGWYCSFVESTYKLEILHMVNVVVPLIRATAASIHLIIYVVVGLFSLGKEALKL